MDRAPRVDVGRAALLGDEAVEGGVVALPHRVAAMSAMLDLHTTD